MYFPLLQPLLAIDIGDVVIGLIALIAVILKQLFDASKKGAPNVPRPQVVPPPQQPNAPPVPQPAAGQQADPLRAQVEEFLRRAGRPQGQPQPAPSREIEVLVDPTREREQRTIGQPLQQADWRKAKPDPAATPKQTGGGSKSRQNRNSGKQRRQSVAEHVAEQVVSRSRSLSDQASKLGQRIVAEDQQFDVQLKAKFDHTVGTLADSSSPAAADPSPTLVDTPAAQLAAMLANPGGIRQAVLLNEIMNRPSDRW